MAGSSYKIYTNMYSLRVEAKRRYLKHYGKYDSVGAERAKWLSKFAKLLGYNRYPEIPYSSQNMPEEVARALNMLNGPYFHAALKMLEVKQLSKKKGLQKASKKVA